MALPALPLTGRITDPTGVGAPSSPGYPASDDPSTEDWLQKLLEENPELLPIGEIDSAWGPLVSLGREIPTSAGFIDNLYVSPAGRLTVVEAKLWRNPEARRKVVGQILDYAAALAALSYEKFEDAVRSASRDKRTIRERVAGSPYADEAVAEAVFIDRVSGNLRAGRFLLLIVGDGIRSDLHGMAELLGSRPGLGFHLELVELRLYSMPDDGQYVVVPGLVGRTAEVGRVTIDVQNSTATSVSVVVEPPAGGAGTGKFSSVEEYVMRATEAIGEARAEAIGALAAWWMEAHGGLVILNKRSIRFSSRYPYTDDGSASVMTVGVDGVANGMVDPIATWHQMADRDDVIKRFGSAGFTGDPLWPRLELHLTRADEVDGLHTLLAWAAATIAAASAAPPPRVAGASTGATGIGSEDAPAPSPADSAVDARVAPGAIDASP